MKKTVLVLAVLMLAVPVMAGVTITPVHLGAGVVQVNYSAPDGNIPRAFALDVRMNPANGTALAPTNFNTNFYVAPGTFSYVGGVTTWGNPIVGPNTVGFTTEMGSLWASNDGNHPTQPPSSGELFRFTVDKSCHIDLLENAQRGGVVMESTAVSFPSGYVTLNDVNVVLSCTVPNEVNVPEATATAAIIAAGFGLGTRTEACNAGITVGNIISTNPPAGPATCGIDVNYVVCVQVQVPNVVGMPEANAVAAIQAVCLNATPKTYQWNAAMPRGRDINQVPAAGTWVNPGSNVAIGISRGTQPIDCLANDVNQALLTTQKTSFTSYVNNRWDPNGWCRFGNVGAPTTAGYQCHGDADGKTTGAPFNYRIQTGDLTLITTNWQKTLQAYPNGADPRADIDHKSTGAPFNYRVATNDLNRVIWNWQRKDTGPNSLPKNCPLTDVNNNNYVKGSW